jgi:hypothetical protein
LQNKYGAAFAKKLTQVWLTDLVKKKTIDPNHCSALIGTCEYYLCEEARGQCGAENYLISFGYKYCSLSLDGLYQNMGSSLGKFWSLNTVRCLQSRIEKYIQKEPQNSFSSENRCEQMAIAAYNSHPDCYIRNGFCRIPLRDKMHIFETIKSKIFSSQTLGQMVQTLSKCGAHPECRQKISNQLEGCHFLSSSRCYGEDLSSRKEKQGLQFSARL